MEKLIKKLENMKNNGNLVKKWEKYGKNEKNIFKNEKIKKNGKVEENWK